jgi:Uncharacterized conserved protein
MRDVILIAGKTMRYIPSAIFTMGSDEGYPEEAPTHTVEIREFYLDETPVTNAEYKLFCDTTGKQYPASPNWDEYEDYFCDCPDSPVVKVTRADAMSYALWVGKRLPSEEEWEFAASGGLKNAIFPWGINEYEASKYANFADSSSDYKWRNPYFNDIYKHTSPVKTYLPNRFGLYDIAGNVWEWTSGYFYEYGLRYVNKAISGGQAVQRGGCYHSTTRDLKITRRRRTDEGDAADFCGFRCAINVNDAEKLEECDRSYDPINSLGINFKHEPLFNLSLNNDTEAYLQKHESISGNDLCAVFISPCDIEPKKLAKLGFTCIEQYIDWESCERKSKGEWDFSQWDRLYQKAHAAGLKWRPCLVAFPKCSLPKWYRESGEFTSLVCLEHNMSSEAQSIWDKRFLRHMERFFAAISDHFKAQELCDGISLSVCGSAGAELLSKISIFCTEKTGWYHCHTGYWCGDAFARQAFRSAIVKKYGSIDIINDAWGTEFSDINKITYPQIITSPNDFRVDEPTSAGYFRVELPEQKRRLIDFIDWYRDSLTEYCSSWLKIARKYFIDTPLTLCIGNKTDSWLASNPAAQCKVAAEYGASVRILGGSNAGDLFYTINFAVSACNFYNIKYSLCLSNKISEKNYLSALYNACAVGAHELQISGLSCSSETGITKILRNNPELFFNSYKFFKIRTPKREFAVLLHDLSVLFHFIRPEYTNNFISALRDFSDFYILDETMITDGALEYIKVLYIYGTSFFREETLKKIKKFVVNGGLLVALGVNDLSTSDGEFSTRTDSIMELLHKRGSGTRIVGRGATLSISIPNEPKNRIAHIRSYAAQTSDFLKLHGIELPDGQLDGIYTAKFVDLNDKSCTLLTFSENDGIKETKIEC